MNCGARSLPSSRIPDGDQRDDDDQRGDVLEALMLDGSVPMTIDAQAGDGLVILTGTTQWHYQREEAESRTAEVPGVACIDNAIILAQLDAGDAGAAIKAAFRRNAVLEADELSVETFRGGLVILSGTVRVDDRISVETTP